MPRGWRIGNIICLIAYLLSWRCHIVYGSQVKSPQKALNLALNFHFCCLRYSFTNWLQYWPSFLQVHHHMSIDELRKIFQVEHHHDGKLWKRFEFSRQKWNIYCFSVPDYEIVQIHSVRHKRSASALEDVHRVNLATHGRQLRLELKQNHHLVPRQRDLDLWYADAFPTNVSYSPADNVSISKVSRSTF